MKLTQEQIENFNQEEFDSFIRDIESQVKSVWEIDGTTVYIRDITINNNDMSVDWFTFDGTVDKEEMGKKVESLALKLYGGNVCQSQPLFSRICSSIKSIFGSSGRT